MGTIYAIQWDGERHPVERWAYRGWREGWLTDPLILRSLRGAVAFLDWYGGRVD